MSKQSENRDLIISELKQEMMGPGEYPGVELDCSEPIYEYSLDDPYSVFVQKGNREEILKNNPLQRYTVGVLFPLTQDDNNTDDTFLEGVTGTEISEDDEIVDEDLPDPTIEKHGADVEDDEDSDDQNLDVFRVNSYRPSSMGVSLFANIEEGSEVVVQVTGARYEKQRVITGKKDDKYWWLRVPINFQVRFPSEKFNHEGPKRVLPTEIPNGKNEGISVEVYSRELPLEENKSKKLLTVSLVNRTNNDNGRQEERCLFQSRFEVSIMGKSGSKVIDPYPSGKLEEQEDEAQSLRLLYRNRKTFAIGHGCSADWVITDGQDLASSVVAEVMPITEIPNVTSDINIFAEDDLMISMKSLAGLVEGDDGFTQLYELLKRYRNWITDKEQLDGVDESLKPIANIHIKNCKSSLASMEEGLEYLKSDDMAMKAFQLANKAVLLQQIAVEGDKRRLQFDNKANKSSFSEPFKEPSVSDIPENRGNWRPFQVAFLLTTIKSIGDPQSTNRNIVDLLWFPTGGGKTEAYLGLTAFSIFLRRLRNPKDSGAQVLMRYTLRLLTSQQFQRASALICSMEIIRREIEKELGTNPISIGLWLGSGTTPNSASEAQERYRDLNKGNKTSGNSFAVLQCPWCRAQIGPYQNLQSKGNKLKGYKRIGNKIIIACADMECPFYEALPLYVVDDYIYEAQPDLLIGTVDKFAQLAWRPKARRLFGLDENGERVLSPPSLIIQDELHLISGPLGSMVGIYEGLIDDLCTDKRGSISVTPKIISSTATIRRSHKQIGDLYNRESVIFPSPGTEIEDSFFSRFTKYAKSGELIPGKKYVGIYPSNSGSTAGAQVRVYSALIQAPMELEKNSRDPWWTIMAFYNSLRELGSSSSIIFHEVQNALRPLYRRKNKKPEDRRWVKIAKELTGRVKDEELGTILDALSIGIGGDSQDPYDACLASNIIEVGIDIDRLALMLVVGQPKTTSQYIQVTGRVGRQWERGIPGLIVTLYGAGKPRDKSHFEKFRSYHEQLYAHVEPTSVTPFASPVLDRALGACMIAYIRQNGIQDDGPYPFPEELAEEFKNLFYQRIKSIDPGELDNFENKFQYLVDHWKRFGKIEWGKGGGIPGDNDLMTSTSSYIKPAQIGTILRTPISLRAVDKGCKASVTQLYLKGEDNV